jgi:MerR family transcriptional regulator, aldehyde-responsive regulator
MSDYSIQQVAQQTGVAISALRYYDDEGLLPELQRLPNGHRRFSDDDVAMVEFIVCLRETGMPIRDLKHYVALAQQTGTGEERCQLLEAHRDEVLAKMTSLESQLGKINSKIDLYYKALGK